MMSWFFSFRFWISFFIFLCLFSTGFGEHTLCVHVRLHIIMHMLSDDFLILFKYRLSYSSVFCVFVFFYAMHGRIYPDWALFGKNVGPRPPSHKLSDINVQKHSVDTCEL